MLLSMCYCAPGHFRVFFFSIFRVIALDVVKISNFQLLLHVTEKEFDLVMTPYKNVAQHV
jgi:hypothetical protein